MLDTEMLIGAKFVAGTEAAEAVINPKTEETIVTLPDASVAQVDAAVNAADEGVSRPGRAPRPPSARASC